MSARCRTTSAIAYLRPETAQAIFAQFKNVLETSRQKVPFGIAQVGKAFRNEVTPRNFTFRSREFEQMELEFFIKPDEVVEAIAGRVATAAEARNSDFRRPELGEALRPTLNQIGAGKRGTNTGSRNASRFTKASACRATRWSSTGKNRRNWRITPAPRWTFSTNSRSANATKKGELTGEELEGIAARSDFDLSQHERFSGKPMGVFDEELRAAWGKLRRSEEGRTLAKRYYESRMKYLIKTGVEPAKAEKEAKEDAERPGQGPIHSARHRAVRRRGPSHPGVDLQCLPAKTTMTDEKGKMETRVMLKFHPRVAPIKVAVLPLLKNKPELVKKAQEVRDLLRPQMNVFYDDARLHWPPLRAPGRGRHAVLRDD